MKQKLLFAAVMGLITTGVVSFTLISFNLGFTSGFVPLWLKSWILVYFTAVPVIILLSPKVQLLVAHLCKQKQLQ
jgi:hypothetical protein